MPLQNASHILEKASRTDASILAAKLFLAHIISAVSVKKE